MRRVATPMFLLGVLSLVTQLLSGLRPWIVPQYARKDLDHKKFFSLLRDYFAAVIHLRLTGPITLPDC
jgi:hypothetical protein